MFDLGGTFRTGSLLAVLALGACAAPPAAKPEVAVQAPPAQEVKAPVQKGPVQKVTETPGKKVKEPVQKTKTSDSRATPEAATAPPPQPDRQSVTAAKWMIATANPLAAEAGRDILRRGGSAIDAAIAAQMVLNLVEPQSSGIGGGGFLLHYNNKTGEIAAYDGRETAPAGARPGMFLDDNGKPRKFFDAVVGGLSVGVPGMLRMLEMAHRENGKLPWKELFDPAIALATGGFLVSERLNGLIGRDKYLKTFGSAAAYFYDPDGRPRPVGWRLKNPQLAETFRVIAGQGADAFYNGRLAESVVETVNTAKRNPGSLSLDDMKNYRAIKRDPVCLLYRKWVVCGMGPPSSGGISTLQILGILQSFDLAARKPADGKKIPDAGTVHLIAEASGLAFADRAVYIADPDFIPVPVAGMLDPGYLELRAGEIDPLKTNIPAPPGMPGLSGAWDFAPSADGPGLSTTHLSVIDGDGNAVAMTNSIENAFGSRLMTDGFLLNNQLTDFSFRPENDQGPIANAVEPGKRPRSSMAPTLVFDGNGKVVMAIGSPGGSNIIGYVAKTLIAALDWNMDIQRAIDMPHFTNRNGPTDLEKGSTLATLKLKLQSLGHTVRMRTMTSGLHGIRVRDGKLIGGADRRREGIALGD